MAILIKAKEQRDGCDFYECLGSNEGLIAEYKGFFTNKTFN